MARTLTLIVVVLAGLGVTGQQLYTHRAAEPAPAATETTVAPETAVVSAGRVEPASEEIDVAAEIGGRLASVPVQEGDRVRRGQVIALVADADYRAQVAEAEARVAQEEARLRRVVNGAREQERQEAAAAVRETDAVVANAKAELDRRRDLYESGVLSREEADRAQREYLVAVARKKAAEERSSLVDAAAREEDRAEAEASLALARAQLADARARLAKTRVLAPIDGVVLKRHLLGGESVPFDRPSAIVTLGDSTRMRVRAEVDETDIAKVAVGQRAYVTADAYGDRKFWGRVVRVGSMLGRKNIRTDEPTERVDTKVLEVLVELEDASPLPSGLRVDTFFVGSR